MVELYSLKLLGDLTGIDQDVAQLQFESSLIDQSLSLGLDPNMISTDSLDMEKIHLRCETNKNDYKLTFEDSGQWTTSGIANSPDDESTAEDAANLTTWGRIRSTEPFDEKTISLPGFARKNLLSPTTAPVQQPQRPASLVANFVDRKSEYEYSDNYSDNGRVLDVNDNEIGFVPESTAPLQKVKKCVQKSAAPLKPPRRTFADLGSSPMPRDDSGFERSPLTETAPELKFLSLPFEVPSFCEQQPPNHIPSLDDLIRQTKQSHLSSFQDTLMDQKMTEFLAPDSGHGSSSTSSTAGPSHVEDWASLAFLLPKHVVDACSFFKSNSHVLTSSSPASDKLLFAPGSRQSTSGVPRSNSSQKCCHSSADSGIAASRTRTTCDCQTQSLFFPTSNSNGKLCISSKLKLHAQELSIIGLPTYNAKRILVERVVEGVAEMVRGAPATVLVTALEALLEDGLNDGLSCWDLIESVTAPGPATSNVFQIVKDLGSSEKPKNSRSQYLFKELLRLRSLDGWLSYVALKENVLHRVYDGSRNAFMLRANTAYRSLFWRLIESLELLTVIEQRPKKRDRGDSGMGVESSTWGSATRIVQDSRVPKSSSVPQLVNETLPVATPAAEKAPSPVKDRPDTLNIQIPRTPSPSYRAAASPSRMSVVSPSQSQSHVSNESSTSSLRRSRIPIPSNTSPATSTISSRLRTPSSITVAKTLGAATNAILNTASSPTRLPLYRKSQYGSRAISQQRPLTTTATTCRYETRRPTTTTTVNRSRKYY